MGLVRDPAFWHRFSVAVHQDEEAKIGAQRPGLTHSYVISSKPLPPSPSTLVPSQPHSPVSTPQSTCSDSSQPTLTRKPTVLKKSPPAKLVQMKSQPSTPQPQSPAPIHKTRSPYRHTNRSFLDLNLAGRPSSRFKFVTNVSVGVRESWLERQTAKKSRRTWMCWVFWVVFLTIVAGVVVTILLLKSKGII